MRCFRYLSLVLAFVLLSSTASSQNSEWKRITADNETLSIELPEITYVHKDKYQNRVFVAIRGLSVQVTRQKRDGLRYIDSFRPGDDDSPWKREKVTFREFTVYRSYGKFDAVQVENIYLGSKDRLYRIRISTTLDQPNYQRIVDSIAVKGEGIFKELGIQTSLEATAMEFLDTSNEVTELLDTPRASYKVIRIKALPDFDLGKEFVRRSRPPVLVYEERPQWSPGTIKQGTMKARLLVGADGIIKEIIVDPTLNADLAKTAAEALRKFKILPAQSDGKNVESVYDFQFRFNVL